jgi:hypothetical protein
MNGALSVWCTEHRRRAGRDGQVIYHVTGMGACDSKWFLVRRERQVGPESALHELAAAEAARRTS